MAESRHPGISMHKLPVGAGFIGLVFTVGCALIFLIGVPQLWPFVALSLGFGVILAVFFRAISGARNQRAKPLSILSATDDQRLATARRPGRRPTLRVRAVVRSA